MLRLFTAAYLAVVVGLTTAALFPTNDVFAVLQPLVLRYWAFLGLFLGLGTLIPLSGPQASSNSLLDPATVCWVLFPVYVLHQVEEWGIDFLGRPYAFKSFMNKTAFGCDDTAADVCPMTAALGFTINVGHVWVSALLGAVLGPHKSPMAISVHWGTISINQFLHIVPAITTRSYNSGLGTSLLLFLPFSVLTAHVLRRAGIWGAWHVVGGLGWGIVAHAILFATIRARAAAVIEDSIAHAVFWAFGALGPLVSHVLARPAAAPTSAAKQKGQ